MKLNGEALRTICSDRDVSFSQLSAGVGVERSHISNLAAGRRQASAGLIRAIAAYLKVDVLALLGPENPEVAQAEALTGEDWKPKAASA